MDQKQVRLTEYAKVEPVCGRLKPAGEILNEVKDLCQKKKYG
jgi:hypothetical protein